MSSSHLNQLPLRPTSIGQGDTEENPNNTRAALIRAVRGKYQKVPTSSEDFSVRKQEEIHLEEGIA